MNQLGILSHVWNVFSFPYNKTIRWTDESIVSHDWNWTQPSNIYILAPTKHNVQHRSAWTSHLEPCLTGPFPTFANQYVEYMNKVEMSRHLYILNSSPSPEKQYTSNTPKNGLSTFTIPWPYAAIPWTCDHSWHFGSLLWFHPLPPALYKPLHSTYDPTWHLGSFLKYTPLDLSICWTNEVNWHVESASSRFFALPTLQNNMLNQQNCHLKSFLKFTRPSTLQGNTFNILNQLGTLSDV